LLPPEARASGARLHSLTEGSSGIIWQPAANIMAKASAASTAPDSHGKALAISPPRLIALFAGKIGVPFERHVNRLNKKMDCDPPLRLLEHDPRRIDLHDRPTVNDLARLVPSAIDISRLAQMRLAGAPVSMMPSTTNTGSGGRVLGAAGGGVTACGGGGSNGLRDGKKIGRARPDRSARAHEHVPSTRAACQDLGASNSLCNGIDTQRDF